MLKKFFLSILVVFLLLCALVIALPTIVATDYVKAFIEDQLTESLETKIKISNPLALKLGLPLLLEANGLTVFNTNETTPIVDLGSLSAKFDPLALIFGEIRVSDLKIGEAKTNLLPNRTLVIKSLATKNLTHGEIKLTSDLKIDETPLQISAALGELKPIIDSSILNFKAKITSGENKLAANGIFNFAEPESKFEISTKLEGIDAQFLSDFTETQGLPASPYLIDAIIKRNSPNNLNLDIRKLSLGDNSLNAKIQLAEIETLQNISGSIVAQNIKLPILEPSKEPESESKNSESLSELFKPLEKINAKIDISIDKLLFAKQSLQNLSASISANGKDININSLEAISYGGKLNGSAALTTSGLSISAKGESIHFDQLNSDGFIEGVGTAIVNLKAKGENLPQLISNLSGKAEFLSEGGKLNSSSALIASSGIHDALPKLFGDETKAEVNCMISRFDVAKSVASIQDYVLQIGKVSVFATGKIDFPKFRLSTDFYTRSSLPALASLIPPFKVFGDLNDPTVLPNPLGIVSDVADSAQGLAESAGSVAGAVGNLLVESEESEELNGLASCEEALEADKRMLTSQLGNLLKDSPEVEEETP